jgi:tripartite-type tricarboxylate transporter receptor subunit TctC
MNILKKVLLATVTVASLLSSPAYAEWIPQRPVTIVMPFSPGGGTDIILRHIQSYGERQNITFVPDYRSGAEGLLAMRHGASQRGDGYSLTIGTIATMAIRHDRFDAAVSFDHITALRGNIFFLVTNTNIHTFEDLISMMRDSSQNITSGSGAPSQRIILEDLINYFAPNSNNPIANYRGTSNVIQDLIGKHIHWAFMPGSAVIPAIRSRSIRVVATEVDRDQTEFGVPSILEFMPNYHRDDFTLISMPRNSDDEPKQFWINWFRNYINDPQVMADVIRDQCISLPFGRDYIIQSISTLRHRLNIQ